MVPPLYPEGIFNAMEGEQKKPHPGANVEGFCLAASGGGVVNRHRWSRGQRL